MRERTSRPLRRRPPAFVLARAATQVGLLAAVLAIIVVGTALLGTGALLLTTAQDQALVTAMRHAAPDTVDVTAVVRPERDDDAIADPTQVRTDTTAALVGALYPFPTTTSTWLSSTSLLLPSDTGVRQYGYLEDMDGLDEHSRLLAGRWPQAAAPDAPLEVAVLRSTAEALGLTEGSTLVLSPRTVPSPGQDAANGGTTAIVVVGIITPAQGEAAVWTRDPLDGAGSAAGSQQVPTYGPFVVAPATLLSVGVDIDHMSIVVRPDLSDGDPRQLERVGSALSAARADPGSVLADHAVSLSVRSPFPATLAIARAQQGVTGSGALAVTLLGVGVAAAALGLAGRLVVARRAAESALLSARGASRSHLVQHAAAEAVALATFGTALAVPLALALYRLIVTLPQLSRAELDPQTTVTPALGLAVAAGSAALAAMLVAPSLRSPDRSGSRARLGGLVARSGADLLLTGIAVLGFFQLRAHRVATSAAIDPILVAAPVLCLVAGAVLVLRVLPLVARLAELLARGSRRLTVPLAGWELARRPHATSSAFLLVLATAAATFGVAFTQTWSGSQQDQADVAVGTDIAVDVVGAAPLAQGRALAEATGATPTPVTARPVGLGSRAGGGTAGVTRLVALDTTQAGEVLRGRLPATQSWAQLSRGLAPEQPAGGPQLPATDVLTLSVSGAGADGTPLLVTPTLILQDSWGDRVAVTAPDVPLDGRPHTLRVQLSPDDGPPVDPALRLVAMDLSLALGDGAEVPAEVNRTTAVTVAVQIVDGKIDDGAGPARWSAAEPPTPDQIVWNGGATQAAGPAGATVTASANVSLTALLYSSAHLVVTAFDSSADLPIVVSTDLAESLDLEPGDLLSLALDTVNIRAVVVRVVPYVPSAARSPALLTDHDALTRAVIAQGRLTAMTDTWWIGDAARVQSAADAVQAQHLGEPVTRFAVATELREGPLRAPLRVAVWLLVAAAVVLSLAGTAVHTAASLEARSVDVARLQGLGVPRRSVVLSFLLQHAVVSLLAVTAGAGVGALVAAAAGPLLVVSATGLPPVPDALLVWPWPAQGTVLAGVLLAGTLVSAPVAVRVVRRATVAHLRMDAS